MTAAQEYNLVEMLLTAGQGGRPGIKITPKGLVIHWTANTRSGANARANRNYFENHPANKVSAHYCVDDKEVILCVPEYEMAYHVGATSYKPDALRLLSSYPNNCTIGIEMCVNQDANFARMCRQTVALAADILTRYGWRVDKLWRHYDITGKDCPRYFVADQGAKAYGFSSAAAGWVKFKADVQQLLSGGKEVNNSMFNDMNGHWAADAVAEAAVLGLVAGKGDGAFGPNDGLTRAQGAVLSLRVYKKLSARVEALEQQLAKLSRG